MFRSTLLLLSFATYALAQFTCQDGAGFPGCDVDGDCPPPAAGTIVCLPTPATATDPAGTCCPSAALVAATTTVAATTVAGATTTAAGVTTTASGVTVTGTATTRTSNTSCVDLLNPRTGVSDCPARATLCNDATYYDVMTRQCPKTCGRCSSTTPTASGACVDRLNPKTGVSDCPGLRRLCNDATYLTVMTTQCPKTCGRCTTGTTGTGSTVTTTASSACVDLTNPRTGISDCAQRANLCTNAAYRTLMQTQCPRTCGFC